MQFENQTQFFTERDRVREYLKKVFSYLKLASDTNLNRILLADRDRSGTRRYTMKLF